MSASFKPNCIKTSSVKENDEPQREQLKSLSKGENGLRPNPL
jgi:hypothetical protein